MNYSELLQLAKGWGNFLSDRIIIWRLRRTYALGLTSASKQEAVQIDICADPYLEAVPPAKQMCPAPHLDNSHTIELMMDNVSLKVSNSADPFLLQQFIRMLRTDQC